MDSTSIPVCSRSPRVRPELDWRQGDTASLPFPDASFDRVLCQFALMFFPDLLAALREMRRVLAPGGSVALATWDAIEIGPPYARQAGIVARLAGAEAAAIVRSPFALHDAEEVRSLLGEAGFASVECATNRKTVTYPSIDAFFEGEFDATPLGAFLRGLGGTTYDRAKAEMAEALLPFRAGDGVTFPIGGHVFFARAGA